MTGFFKGLLCRRESRLQDTVGSREASEAMLPAFCSQRSGWESAGDLVYSTNTHRVLMYATLFEQL